MVKWVQNNKMVLYLTKNKSIVFESNSKLKLKPLLNLSVNSVPIDPFRANVTITSQALAGGKTKRKLRRTIQTSARFGYIGA